MRKTTVHLLVMVIISMGLTGCAELNRTAKGGMIGATTGAILGGVIGKQSGNTTAGILIGAALGGVAGASIGHYMDKQAAEIQNDIKNAKVERVGEGIKITFDSGILFDTNSAVLKSASRDNIASLSKTLNKYKDTNIVIQGYTDSDGSDDYNLALSQKRAESVSGYTVTQGVLGSRISTAGMGESNPVSDNSTAAGKQTNRRVEIAIFANDKLKKAATEGKEL
ncbi:MAG: OmpA family protein [Elusimicrobiota bacterium]